MNLAKFAVINHLVKGGQNSGWYITQSIKLSRIEFNVNPYIYFHPAKTSPRGYITPYSFGYTEDELSEEHTLTAEPRSVRLLPHPYQTNCLNYKTLGFDDREHALDNCSYDLALKYGHLCYNSLMKSDLINDNLIWFTDFENKFIWLRKIYHNLCMKKYAQLDCYTEVLTTTYLNKFRSHSFALLEMT